MRQLITVSILLLASVVHAGLPSAPAANVTQSLTSGKPVVIDLGARTCVQCRKMAPILEALAKEYRGRAGILFIDVSTDIAAADRFGIRMIPTQIFFNAQGKELKRHIGFMGKAGIEKELRAAGLK